MSTAYYISILNMLSPATSQVLLPVLKPFLENIIKVPRLFVKPRYQIVTFGKRCPVWYSFVMDLSFNTRVRPDNMSSLNGYGYATEGILASLARLGHNVQVNDPEQPVGFWFDQPQHWKWTGSSHRIGIHPWESSRLHDGWQASMNRCDEIWTPSPVVAEWYRNDGVAPPVFVYKHGVDYNVWTLRERSVDDKICFLHVGGEAVRKGLDITMEAFRKAFYNNNDVEIILKMNAKNWRISRFGKVRAMCDAVPLSELVKLYHNNHVFVYPSWGEGFGLNPLQAMSTGMPTICTGAWAPYKDLMDPDLIVSSKLVPSPWPKIHPGNMFKPDLDDVIDKMRFVAANYDEKAKRAVEISQEVKRVHDWDTLTNDTFSALEKRLRLQKKL